MVDDTEYDAWESGFRVGFQVGAELMRMKLEGNLYDEMVSLDEKLAPFDREAEYASLGLGVVNG